MFDFIGSYLSRRGLGPKVTLDPTGFPHIMELIMDYSAYETLLILRRVSKELKDEVDWRLAKHVVIVEDPYNVHCARILSAISRARPRLNFGNGNDLAAPGQGGRLPLLMPQGDPTQPGSLGGYANWRERAKAALQSTEVMDLHGSVFKSVDCRLGYLQVGPGRTLRTSDELSQVKVFRIRGMTVRPQSRVDTKWTLTAVPTRYGRFRATNVGLQQHEQGLQGSDNEEPWATPSTFVFFSCITPTEPQDLFGIHHIHEGLSRFVVNIAYDPRNWLPQKGVSSSPGKHLPYLENFVVIFTAVTNPHNNHLPAVPNTQSPSATARTGAIEGMIYGLLRFIGIRLELETRYTVVGLQEMLDACCGAHAITNPTSHSTAEIGELSQQSEVSVDAETFLRNGISSAACIEQRRGHGRYLMWQAADFENAIDSKVSLLTPAEYQAETPQSEWRMFTSNPDEGAPDRGWF